MIEYKDIFEINQALNNLKKQADTLYNGTIRNRKMTESYDQVLASIAQMRQSVVKALPPTPLPVIIRRSQDDLCILFPTLPADNFVQNCLGWWYTTEEFVSVSPSKVMSETRAATQDEAKEAVYWLKTVYGGQYQVRKNMSRLLHKQRSEAT